jgi:hypothetical protein
MRWGDVTVLTYGSQNAMEAGVAVKVEKNGAVWTVIHDRPDLGTQWILLVQMI